MLAETLSADERRLVQIPPRAIEQLTSRKVIPPDAERLFAKRMGANTVELASSHVAMVSHPDEVCKLIETAANAVPVAT